MTLLSEFSRILRRETGVEQFIPYTAHITENIIKLAGGDYVMVFRLQGAAHESAGENDLEVWHEQLNGFLRSIASPNIAIWTHTIRRPGGIFPDGDFPPGFARDFNNRYRERMISSQLLVNELYLSIIYRPRPVAAMKILDIFRKDNDAQRIQEENESIDTINDLAAICLSALDRYGPQLLGCHETDGNICSEILAFLACLTNGQWKPFPLPGADIRHVFSTARPFFGKGGLMALKTPVETQYGAALSIREYPSTTHPGLLNELLALPFPFVLTQSFTFLSKPLAIAKMKRQQQRMVAAGDVAISQINDINVALDDLVSNRFVMGTHHLSLLILLKENAGEDSTIRYVNDAVGMAGNALSDAGMKWGREDIGLGAAFFAQLPGNFPYRIRTGDISSRNFAGLTSFHNYPAGRRKGNQWGNAVTLFRTTSGSPYYFNFHQGETTTGTRQAHFDPNHKDLANTVVIGKSGTGKTVLQMLLLAQMQKFHQPREGKYLTCVLFDKDLGAAVGVRAMGGRYYPLKNGHPSGFNPFRMEPTPNNLAFLETLVRQLVRRDGFPITIRQERQISEAIRNVLALPVHLRRIHSLLAYFNPNEENGIHERLTMWCRNGSCGWLFDNDEDTLELDDTTIIGFDVTEFLDNPQTRTPTILYLFHRIEQLMDGRRIAIFMDEFWKLLDDEAFEDLAQNKLVTIRKQNGFLIMFTQSPGQVLNSPISYAIISQSATKIMLPNPEADYDDYVNGFKLSEREYEIIRTLGEKSRRFLIRQGDQSAVAELDLRGFDNELAVMSGNTFTSNLAEKLVAQHGEDPSQWLPHFHELRIKGIQ